MAQTPVNLINIPIEVDIGGKLAAVQYAGRSVYPGLDQINLQAPAGVSGCHTSVVVRTGDIVSNLGTIPVASSGRVCSEPVAGLTSSQIQTLMSQPTVTRGAIEIDTGVALVGNAFDVFFARFTNVQFAARQPGSDCVVQRLRRN